MKAPALLLALLLGLAGCGEGEQRAEAPPPQEPTLEDVGYFCGMAVPNHAGPKGQVFLAGEAEPLWFSSVRDVLAFTRLPEEASRPVTAVYVNDMARAQSWEQPEPGTWVEAEKALYLIGSERRGGMGEAAIVPFSERAAAERFQAQYGGRIYAFAEVPGEAVLGGGLAPGAEPAEGAAPQVSDRPEAAPAAEGGQGHDRH